MAMDRLQAIHNFELRELDKKGRFSGYASVFGVLDTYGTVFDKGAFKKTIKDHKGVFPLTWMHNATVPIGMANVEEDSHGLFVKEGQLDLDVEKGRDVYSGMMKKYITQMSHSFHSLKELIIEENDKKIPHFKEVRLYEIAPVTTNFASNEEALIGEVRMQEERGVISSNLPLGDRKKKWDKAAAEKRVRAWAGAGDEPNAKYRRAFLWYDGENADKFGAYKLMIGDVIGGTLKAMPRAIFAVAVVLQGGRGGVNIPASDKVKVKTIITKYYHKMDEKAPWESKTIYIPVGMAFEMGRLSALLREPPVGTQTGEPRREPGDHLREFREEIARLERVLKKE